MYSFLPFSLIFFFASDTSFSLPITHEVGLLITPFTNEETEGVRHEVLWV